MKAIAAFLVAWLLVGSIALTYSAGPLGSASGLAEVRMGPLAAGSTGGPNGTEGNASVAGSLVGFGAGLLHLNNTNATGVWYAKLVVRSSSGVSNVVALDVGIDNGTARTTQVLASLGALTQTEGTYVRLEPASASVIHLSQTVSILGPDTTLGLDVYAADAADGEAYVLTSANLTIT